MIAASKPILVPTDPLCRRGDLAVWRVGDIPAGVSRFVAAETVGVALAQATSVWPTVKQTETDRHDRYLINRFAAVRWRYLQPHDPIQRNRRPSAVIRTELNGFTTHNIRHKFTEIDVVGCRRCALQAELADALEAEAALGPWVEAPLEPTYTPSNRAARLMIAGMEAKNGEHTVRRAISDQARDAWAAALRAKVKASEEAERERERNRVLVDLHFEPWE